MIVHPENHVHVLLMPTTPLDILPKTEVVPSRRARDQHMYPLKWASTLDAPA